MKKMHFCTPLLLQDIYHGYKILTFRTGFAPSFADGEIIVMNDRSSGKDVEICKGRVEKVEPIKFRNIKIGDPVIDDELNRYGRKFHKDQWFFMITIQPQK